MLSKRIQGKAFHPRIKAIRCHFCKKDISRFQDSFVVKDKIWLTVFKDRRGNCCVGCFEKALGRKLKNGNRGDFTKCPLNVMSGHYPIYKEAAEIILNFLK